jgi:hypothetical protein
MFLKCNDSCCQKAPGIGMDNGTSKWSTGFVYNGKAIETTMLTALLSRDFLRIIAFAFLTAVPIAWYFLNQWLQNFVYRTPFSWWIFPLAGLLSIIIALVTISFQTVKASLANPVDSLRAE